MSKTISLTLNLGREEKDQDLWELLRGLSEEQREDAVKAALHMYMTTTSPVSKTTSSWSLEDLLVSTTSGASASTEASPEESAEESLKSNAVTSGNPVTSQASETAEVVNHPLNHLFALIGEEDDQDVFEFFRPSSGATSVYVTTGDPYSADKVEDSSVTLATPKPVQGNGFMGLDYILDQVIGREEDPEVLSFFRSQERSELDES
ncbi:hypothetical protein Desdi_2279 [Desulfitobacterium dichloroeliminans LMG P-21439]|uniref:Uncharacterized protein n=1 Tax=Desulfitobacterium dichloroeliminans (strain LMG P-21439 / DCA1) TaxID=871963 RepID=L0F792_DESDL|nr:hypothetical protein [Desulfitobacterium dichloroeliminans]AGA69709.1 hypothetical protein Desdi_2279 [Desulfitobacterium dichloroeliminans LMG P-21439]